MIDPKIFKRYDIRGKYPDDINPAVSRLLVDAYVKIFKPERIVIGHDPLEGSRTIYTSVCDQF